MVNTQQPSFGAEIYARIDRYLSLDIIYSSKLTVFLELTVPLTIEPTRCASLVIFYFIIRGVIKLNQLNQYHIESRRSDYWNRSFSFGLLNIRSNILELIDCSQSPIFPWDLRRAAILVSRCERNWGEYKMPVGRGWWGGENRKIFSSPPHPYAINLTATTHGHFVLSPVSLASRDQDGGPSNSTIGIYGHLRSHWKIGDCEQSIELTTQICFPAFFTFLIISLALKKFACMLKWVIVLKVIILKNKNI